jgi:hypothetical protein
MDELKEVESEKVGEWMNTELVDIYGTYIWCIHLWYIQMEYFRYLNFNHHIYVLHMLSFGYVVSILNCICVGISMLNLSSDFWLIMWLYLFSNVLSYITFTTVHGGFHTCSYYICG